METNQKVAGLKDMDGREILALLPMVILIFWIGIYPDTFLGFMHKSVEHLIARVNMGGAGGPAVAKNIIEVIR